MSLRYVVEICSTINGVHLDRYYDTTPHGAIVAKTSFIRNYAHMGMTVEGTIHVEENEEIIATSHLPGDGLFDRITFRHEFYTDFEWKWIRSMTLPVTVRKELISMGGGWLYGYWFDQTAATITEDPHKDSIVAECAYLAPNEGNMDRQTIECDDDDPQDLFFHHRVDYHYHIGNEAPAVIQEVVDDSNDKDNVRHRGRRPRALRQILTE